MREGCSKPTVSWEDQNTQRVFTHCANRSSQTLLVQLPSADKQASSWRGRTSLIRFLPFTQFCVFNIPSKPDWENVPLCFLPMQHNLRASVCMSSQKRSCLPLLGHLRNTPLRSLVGHSHNVRSEIPASNNIVLYLPASACSPNWDQAQRRETLSDG